jgi:4a-hydroxytetrahydrobiopterin dehydratase
MQKEMRSCDLAQKKCIPCSAGVPRLHGNEIQELLSKLDSGWKVVEERHLEKEYEFADFRHALIFTNLVGEIAEKEGHHPDIHLAWGKVKLILWTHKINGLAEADFVLAAKCEQIYGERCSTKACF